MENPIGVIDLGTNTFHLLIVEPLKDGGFQEVYRERRFIQLAEEGIATIGAAPFRRAVDAIRDYHKMLEKHDVKEVRAFGTAALRTASNGAELALQIQEITGIEIQLISGDEEARLIHLGVAQAVPLDEQKVLIMDIGGGSVEFIIADDRKVYWSQSFPIGVAVLYRNYHHSEPIAEDERLAVEAFLQAQLQPLRAALQQYPAEVLVGASGTFDVLEALLVNEKPHPLHARLDASFFSPFYHQMLQTRLEDRLQIKGIPSARAAMLIVALILVDQVMQIAHSREIIISAYAMKEGMLVEML